MLAISAFSSANASQDLCEKIDGDCPDDCAAAGFKGSENFNATILISPSNPKIEKNARNAEDYIKSQGEVIRVDNPETGLHTSLFYFCCHTKEEKAGIKKSL